MIEATAKTKYLRMSARKMRRVANLVKGKMVPEALDMLKFIPKRAALPLYKTVKSAASNAIAEKGSAKVKAEDMRIIELIVNRGPILPRIRFQSMGRVFRIRKRSCHVSVKVSDEGRAETREATKAAKQRRGKSKTKKEKPSEE
ncbi:MAG: 50S ribosomal protein L22 [Candidatus Zixiibacteriota bacterium]